MPTYDMVLVGGVKIEMIKKTNKKRNRHREANGSRLKVLVLWPSFIVE